MANFYNIDELLKEQFIDLDGQVSPQVRPPGGQSWIEILSAAKSEFEIDGAAAVFSTWRVEKEDPIDNGDIKIHDGMYARAGRMALNASMVDKRVEQLITALPKGGFTLKLKFLLERNESDWFVEHKFDPIRKNTERSIFSHDTKPGGLIKIDSVFYQNAYPVIAVIYGLYPLREPDLANLAPMRVGDFICVAQRVIEHFDGALRGHGLTSIRRQKIEEWEVRVHENGARVDDVPKLVDLTD